MAVRPALCTDRYELSMLTSFINEGTVNNRTVWEAFARKLPGGRRYGVVAGIGRLTQAVKDFRFDTPTLTWLQAQGIIPAETAAYLADYQFTGTIDGLRDGDLYFPGTPVVTIEGTAGECVVLETLILSILNHDVAVASAAARMVSAAAGRPIIEMGGRRVHEDAATAAARAAYIAGFVGTSNLAAGMEYDVPTFGTAAHAFTLMHAGIARDGDATGEVATFRTQIATHGLGTTLLVDTYDTAQGIRNAVAAARAEHPDATGPGGIRIDSGDLVTETRKARALLDELGAVDTRITVTSDLDEYAIAELADAPVDGYGAGTRVVTGSGHPTAGMVYKLVAKADQTGRNAPLIPVAKNAAGKKSVGGRKTIWRTVRDGILVAEMHAVANAAVPAVGGQDQVHLAQVPLMRGGRIVHTPSTEACRLHAEHAMATLPADALSLEPGEPTLMPVTVLPTPAPGTLTTPGPVAVDQPSASAQDADADTVGEPDHLVLQGA